MRALITGITGQDGSYLAELLLAKGYEVHGTVRRSSTTSSRWRLDHLYRDPEIYDRRLFLHYAELDDPTTIRRLLLRIEPTELYHLAGQTHVGVSFEIPESTCQTTAMGTLRLLEILRDMPSPPRLLHTSSSDIFGRPETHPQDERTSMRPVSPYGVAKAFATQMVGVYRESFGLFACNAICYNHESPRRGESFVTRKITRAAAAIRLGLQQRLRLGSLETQRDWGYAPEYVEAFWRMLQSSEPTDLVLATGTARSLRDFLDAAFSSVGLPWQELVDLDPRYDRPTDVGCLVGNPARAAQRIGWRAQTQLPELAALMVRDDLERLSGEPAELPPGEARPGGGMVAPLRQRYDTPGG